MPAIEYRILGPLEVRVDDAPVVIARARPRALLAAGLLAAGRAVSVPELIEAVWEDDPPLTADQLVRTYVSQLRARLGDEAIGTELRGYRVEVDVEALDATLFELLARQAAEARARGDAQQALESSEKALGLWRGDVAEGTPLSGKSAAAARRLHDRRQIVREERVELLTELGRDREAASEAARLLDAEPLRERPAALLMLALYRTGRQAEALDVYRDFHKRLVESQGLTPGAELQELQRAILRGEPISRHTPEAVAPLQRRHRRTMVAAGIAATVVAAATGAVALVGRSPSHPLLVPRSLAQLDARTGTVQRVVPLHGQPTRLIAVGRRVWVAEPGQRNILAFDATTLRPLATYAVSFPTSELAGDGTRVWLADGFRGTLTRIAPGGSVAPPFRPLPGEGRLALAVGDGSLWVGSQQNMVARFPVAGGARTLISDVSKPNEIAVTNDSAWVSQGTSVDVIRIDTRTNQIVRRIPLGGIATALAVTPTAVWALTPGENEVWQINPSSSAVVASFAVPDGTTALAAVDDTVWAATDTDGTLTHIDPHERTTTTTAVDLHHPLGGFAANAQHLYVTTRE